jgi:hypothetical protein
MIQMSRNMNYCTGFGIGAFNYRVFNAYSNLNKERIRLNIICYGTYGLDEHTQLNECAGMNYPVDFGFDGIENRKELQEEYGLKS